jgi:triacylglycerol lipase
VTLRGNAHRDGVEHTSIVTRTDEVVTPWTSGLMLDGGTNVILQDVCPLDLSEHLLTSLDPVITQLLLNALDPEHATAVTCGL